MSYAEDVVLKYGYLAIDTSLDAKAETLTFTKRATPTLVSIVNEALERCISEAMAEAECDVFTSRESQLVYSNACRMVASRLRRLSGQEECEKCGQWYKPEPAYDNVHWEHECDEDCPSEEVENA